MVVQRTKGGQPLSIEPERKERAKERIDSRKAVNTIPDGTACV